MNTRRNFLTALAAIPVIGKWFVAHEWYQIEYRLTMQTDEAGGSVYVRTAPRYRLRGTGIWVELPIRAAD